MTTQQQKASTKDKKAAALFSSLVKYDTPYLVSTTVNNKKAWDEIKLNEEKTIKFIANIFKRTDSEGQSEFDDYSVKDALNKILPPKTENENDQLWVQYVSCTPVTKAEVLNLKEGLDKRLKVLDAKDTGICLVREGWYRECFDELIRQVTINCLERGILMMLVKKQNEMTMRSYENWYQSSIAYGIRNWLKIEEKKKVIKEKIKDTMEELDKLKEEIALLENEISESIAKDEENRKEMNEKHHKEVKNQEEVINKLKDKFKNSFEDEMQRIKAWQKH